MARYFVQDTSLTAIADAIRSKTGGTAALTLDGMAEAVAGIETGGGGDDLAKQIVERTVTEINDASIEKVGEYAFQSCSNLTSANLPACTSLGSGAFHSCSKLTSVDLPACTSVGGSAFSGCSKLTSVDLPACTSLGSGAFQNCSKLTSVDLPACTSVGVSAFQSCYNLTSVVIRTDSICSLANTSAFNKCYHILGTVNATHNPEGLKDGYIYVPDALVEDYKAATNWSTYASQIKPLSEHVEVTA